MPVSSDEFQKLANEVLNRRSSKSRLRKYYRRFRAAMGISPDLCSWYWNQLEKEKLVPTGFLPKHFLWTLLFLKLYCSETINACICDCDKKTFRKWSWIGIKAIVDLDLVSTQISIASSVIKLLTINVDSLGSTLQ